MRSLPTQSFLGLLMIAALAIPACTSAPTAPPPGVGLASAAIESAHAAGADEAASADMRNARAKLDNALLTYRGGNPLLAAQLAEEAEVDAHAARAKAAYLRSAQVRDQAESSLAELRQKPLPVPAPAPAR